MSKTIKSKIKKQDLYVEERPPVHAESIWKTRAVAPGSVQLTNIATNQSINYLINKSNWTNQKFNWWHFFDILTCETFIKFSFLTKTFKLNLLKLLFLKGASILSEIFMEPTVDQIKAYKRVIIKGKVYVL